MLRIGWVYRRGIVAWVTYGCHSYRQRAPYMVCAMCMSDTTRDGRLMLMFRGSGMPLLPRYMASLNDPKRQALVMAKTLDGTTARLVRVV